MRNRIMLIALLASCGPAAAHVTLAVRTADAGSHFVATFRVGHGCSGSPTTALRIDIPDGVSMARPQPKSGWSIAIAHAKLSRPQKGDMGETITERASAITWKGGPLPADEFDEFSIMLKLPTDLGVLTFPATQTCRNGVEHWSGADKMHPAPTLTVAKGDTPGSMAGMDMSVHTPSRTTASVTVTDGWIRALPAGTPSGGYFTIHNDGDKSLELIGAASPSCGMLMLHKSETAGGTTHMSDVASVAIPPHGVLRFSPGGYHLMCMDAKQSLKPGSKAKVTLKFADGSGIDIDFAVRNATGR